MMKRNYLAVLALAFCLLAMVGNVFAVGDVKYPEPVGYFNDFTGKFSSSVREAFESQLKNYDQQTSNQIAVVMIKSLEKMPIAEYSLALADKWGVGVVEGRKEHYGVVFLIVLEEREMRIEVGHDLEGILTDLKAGRIIRNTVAPLFKQGKVVEGISAGVNEIIETLGPLDPEKRLAEQMRLKELQKKKEKILLIAFAIFTVMSICIALVVFIVSRRYMIRDARGNSERSIREITGLFEELEGEDSPLKHPDSKTTEEVLKKLKVLKSDFEKALASRSSLEGAKWLGFERELKELMWDVSKILRDASRNISRAEEAREDGPKLLASLPKRLKDVEAKLNKEGDSSNRRMNLQSARMKIEEASTKAHVSSSPDWLVIYGLLVVASDLLDRSEHSRSYGSTGSQTSGIGTGSSPSPPKFDGFSGISGGFGGGGADGKW